MKQKTLRMLNPAEQELLRKTEIYEFDVSVVVHDQVLGFQITVGNLLRVKSGEHIHHGSRVESSRLLRELAAISQMSEKLTALKQLKNEIYELVVLKSEKKLGDWNMVIWAAM